jgi:hypothetical protein
MIVDLGLSTAGSARTAATGAAGREITALAGRIRRRSGLLWAIDERAVKPAVGRLRAVFLETSLSAGRLEEPACRLAGTLVRCAPRLAGRPALPPAARDGARRVCRETRREGALRWTVKVVEAGASAHTVLIPALIANKAKLSTRTMREVRRIRRGAKNSRATSVYDGAGWISSISRGAAASDNGPRSARLRFDMCPGYRSFGRARHGQQDRNRSKASRGQLVLEPGTQAVELPEEFRFEGDRVCRTQMGLETCRRRFRRKLRNQFSSGLLGSIDCAAIRFSTRKEKQTLAPVRVNFKPTTGSRGLDGV